MGNTKVPDDNLNHIEVTSNFIASFCFLVQYVKKRNLRKRTISYRMDDIGHISFKEFVQQKGVQIHTQKTWKKMKNNNVN